jgi:2'-5' RNA ligase
LEIQAELRERIGRWLASFGHPRGWKPVPPDNLHLTIAFMDDCPENRTREIAAFLSSLPKDRFPEALAIAGCVFFPDRKRPRVAAMSITDPGGKCSSLAASIRDYLWQARILFDDAKPFRPHLTLGRWQYFDPVRHAGLVGSMESGIREFCGERLSAERPSLFRSIREPGRPPRYERILGDQGV